jgi:hypothetical protein
MLRVVAAKSDELKILVLFLDFKPILPVCKRCTAGCSFASVSVLRSASSAR